MFDYIPNRIKSAKKLNTGTEFRDRSSRTRQLSRFFIFVEKMVGSAAFKQGRLANRKHTYFFFFGLSTNVQFHYFIQDAHGY